MRLSRAALAAMFGGLFGLAGDATAKDYFLTIGGGYNPTGNQISLEKNVLMYQALLSEQYPTGTPHTILFADGQDSGRDLQYHNPEPAAPKVNELLAEILREEKYFGHKYRSHQVPHVAGPSSRATIETWFREQGKTLAAGDRLIMYVTAHGGRGDDKNNPGNTKLHLWNNEHIKMSELSAHIATLPKDVSVVMVMVQCFSGGFANTIFAEGDPAKGAAERNICGFFATVEDRPAAGCTPDIDEENYQEYSSYFWTALRGKRRNGDTIERPDYNHDGGVSFAEAHAWAVLQSPTIDIPVKCSDALLRKVSKLADDKQPDLFSADSRYEDLFALATDEERAVLEGLSTELALKESQRAKEAVALAAATEAEKKKLEGDRNNKYNAYQGIAGEIAKVLKNRWPELNNRWDPMVTDLLTRESDAVVQAIQSHARWAEFEKLRAEIKALDVQKDNCEKKWCKTKRLVRTLENIALAENLKRVAPPETVKRYCRLTFLEGRTFGQPVPNVAAAVSKAN